MELNNLPLEIRLNIMSYNCYDICPYRYNDIIKHPFPTWEKVKRNPFWIMSLTEYLDGKKSEYEIYLELKTFYDYSYIFNIEHKFKHLWFINNIDDMNINGRNILTSQYYDAMRALLSMMPFRTEAEWHIRFYHILGTEDFYKSEEEVSDNESVGSYY